MPIRSHGGSHRRLRSITAMAGIALAILGTTSGCASLFGGGDGGPNQISLMTIDAGADNVQLTAIVNAFNKQSKADKDGQGGTGYTVKVTNIPEDSYDAKFSTAMLGDPPDIASVADIFSFQPLDKIVYGDNNIPLDSFNQALPGNCGLDGKIYCVGTNVGNMILFYNKDLFDAAGIAYPSATTPLTFPEYTSIAHQLTKKGATDDSTVWGTADVGVISWLDPAALVDPTGRKVEVTGPEFEGVIQSLTNAAQAGDMPTADQADALGGGDGVNAMFLDGKLAMVMSDNYLLPQADKAKMNYGIAPAPVPVGTKPWVVTWTNSYGIPTGAKHSAGAAKFLAFMATKGQDIQAKYGYLPLGNAAAQSWADTPIRKQLIQVTNLVRTTVPQPHQGEWQSPLYDAITGAMFGNGKVDAALQGAQPKAQQALNDSWKSYDQATAARKGN